MLAGLILNLVVAGLAGWLTGKIMKFEKGVVWSIILGLCGGVVGGILLGLFGLHGAGFVGSLVVSIIGACVIVWLARLIS